MNQLLDDFVAACQPKHCQVKGAFTPRGGITTRLCACMKQGNEKRRREKRSCSLLPFSPSPLLVSIAPAFFKFDHGVFLFLVFDRAGP